MRGGRSAMRSNAMAEPSGRRRPLFPIAQRVDANTHRFSKLHLSQADETAQCNDIVTRLEPPDHEASSNACWSGGQALSFPSLYVSSNTSGCFSATTSSFSAASLGLRRPCSQSCTVRGLTFSSLANIACEKFMCWRMRTTREAEIGFGAAGRATCNLCHSFAQRKGKGTQKAQTRTQKAQRLRLPTQFCAFCVCLCAFCDRFPMPLGKASENG